MNIYAPLDPPFDPAEDDGEFGWLERAKDVLTDRCKSNAGIALALLEPPADPDAWLAFNAELATAIQAMLSDDPRPMLRLVKDAAAKYVDEHAPELARKLYRIANEECGE